MVILIIFEATVKKKLIALFKLSFYKTITIKNNIEKSKGVAYIYDLYAILKYL
jgi:hypothetical protein